MTVPEHLKANVDKLLIAFYKLPLIVSDEIVLEQAVYLAAAAEVSEANNRATSREVGTKRAIDELVALANAMLDGARCMGELHVEAEKAMAEALGHASRLVHLQKEIIHAQRAAAPADMLDRLTIKCEPKGHGGEKHFIAVCFKGKTNLNAWIVAQGGPWL